MNYQFKPQNKNELYHIIEEIIINQENNKSYSYGLRDVDTSLITDMSYLFSCDENNKNSNINKKINWDDPRNDIGLWNVSNVTSMAGMFRASPFNQDISNWNVSKVTDMSGMFRKSPFNQPIRNWDVSNVTNMGHIFAFSKFNQDINHWNVFQVTNMTYMFTFGEFNQNLFLWIDKLNENVDLNNFNKYNPHEKKYGTINNLKDFIEKQLTPQIWLNEYKKSNDKEKFQLLKLLKNRDKQFIKELNKWISEYNIDIDY